jgi:hypothetical protein
MNSYQRAFTIVPIASLPQISFQHDTASGSGLKKLSSGEMMANGDVNGTNECEKVGMPMDDAKIEVLKGAKWTYVSGLQDYIFEESLNLKDLGVREYANGIRLVK